MKVRSRVVPVAQTKGNCVEAAQKPRERADCVNLPGWGFQQHLRVSPSDVASGSLITMLPGAWTRCQHLASHMAWASDVSWTASLPTLPCPVAELVDAAYVQLPIIRHNC